MIYMLDSKHKKLSMQEVMVRAMYAIKNKLDRPVDQALLLLLEELQMPNSEAIQFGNSVFITHYATESNTCAMYVLNVDTAKNLLKNGELYVRYLLKKGMIGFVTSYDAEGYSNLFKQIEKKHLGFVDTWKSDNKYVTAVMFNASQQERRNA